MPTRWVAVVVVLVLLIAATAVLLSTRRARQDTPAGAVVGTGPAGATTRTPASRSRTFVAVADAKVDAAKADRGYGSSRTLRVDAKPETHGYLRFQVRGLRGTVRSAVLRVWANSRQRPGYRVHRLGTTVAWSEGTTTFARPPAGAVEPTPLGSSGPVLARSWTSVDVTPLLDGGDGPRSLVLQTNGTTGLSLASREDTAHAPRLVVETG